MACTAAAVALNAAGSALATDLDKISTGRLKTLRTCDSLTAAFRYFGEQDKPGDGWKS
jgi:hypothetical protein